MPRSAPIFPETSPGRARRLDRRPRVLLNLDETITRNNRDRHELPASISIATPIPTTSPAAGSSSSAASAWARWRSANCWLDDGLRDRQPTNPLAPKAAAFRRQGQARHLPVHGRRAQPPGTVRQQTASWRSSTARCRPPELLKGYRAAFINPNSKLLGPKFKFAKHGKCGAGALRAAAAHWPKSSTTSPSSSR